MSDGILRKRTMGIAKETTYGVSAASPTYVMPILNEARWNIEQRKIKNPHSAGSTYMNSNMTNTIRLVNFSLEVKVDEDQFPLFWMQKFSIASGLISGESTVYEHVLTYSNTNVGTSFTLFLQDDDREDLKVTGAKFSAINVIAEKEGYFRIQIEGTGKQEEAWTGSNSVVAVHEFVGRHVSFREDDQGGSKAALGILSATFNHSFPLAGEDVNFELGDSDMTQNFTGADEFESQITARYTNTDLKDDYKSNQAKEWDLTITDTGRFVTGSTQSTNPSIVLDYPYGYIDQWTEAGGPDDIVQQEMSLIPVDYIGTSGAPMSITVINAVASY